MKIQNQIEVAAPPDDLFDILSDVERVAPLLPGATLEGKEDDDTYVGVVKVKVGPISVSYRGTIFFQELDRDARRAVMRASGREINGQGSTEATITATVTGSDSESVLAMDTDMEVRGKVAQFGRGAIGNVSQRILNQFARNLEAQVLADGSSENGSVEQPSPQEPSVDKPGAPGGTEASTPTADEDEALDMLSVVGLPTLRRAAPVALGVFVGVLVGWLVASRGRASGGGYGQPMGYGLPYPPPPWYWEPPGREKSG